MSVFCVTAVWLSVNGRSYRKRERRLTRNGVNFRRMMKNNLRVNMLPSLVKKRAITHSTERREKDTNVKTYNSFNTDDGTCGLVVSTKQAEKKSGLYIGNINLSLSTTEYNLTELLRSVRNQVVSLLHAFTTAESFGVE